MVKGFRQIASLTALSRVFGLIRDVSYSHFFGAGGLMDIWVVAFQIPNLARRLFGEGAASASFIPIYRQQLEENPQQAARLANTIVTVIFVLLAGLVLAGWAGLWIYHDFFADNSETKMMLSLISVMLPYMLMICIVALLAGILNVHKHFATPAVAPVVLNIFIISAILLTGWAFKIPPAHQVFIVAAAVLAAGLVQIAIQIPPLRANSVRIRPAWDINSEAFRKVMLLMGPMILGLTVTQINTLGDMWIAKFFSGSMEKGEFFTLLGRQIKYPLWGGAVSYLYYAQRLYQFPLGVFGISLATAIFPVMSSDAAKKDFDALRRTISKGLRGTVFVAIPAMAGLFLVAEPLVSAVFEHGKFTSQDTSVVAWTLRFYALGLCGFFMQQVTTRAFYSMQDSKTPAKSAVVAVFVNLALNLTLIWFMGTGGLALSTAICAYLQVVILTVVLRRKFGSELLGGLATTTVKTVAATTFMLVVGTGIMILMSGLPGERWFNILRLAVVVPATAGAYLAGAKLLRMEMISLLGRVK